MKKTVWTFGLLSGAILSAMMVLTMPFADSISMDTGMVIGYASMVLSFLLVFFGIRSYRDHVAGGRIGFGRAMAVGSLIVLISSLCYVATWQVLYFSKLAPDYLAQYQEQVVKQAQARGATPAQIQEKRAEMEKFAEMYQNPAFNAAITLLEPLPVGLVIALVSAGILSRGRREEQPDPGAALV